MKYGVFLKPYKHGGLETSDTELDDEANNSKTVDESKGKEPAPEPSGICASIMKNSALDVHADEEVYRRDETFPRESQNIIV